LTTQTPAAEEDSPKDDSEASAEAIKSAPAAASTFYALGSPAYRVLWFNSFFMLTAVHLAFTAHNVVAYELTGNNRSVGLISFAIGAALLLTTPVSGPIADRVSKRLLLAVTESLIAVMGVALAVLLFTDALTIELLIVAGLIFGAGNSFFWPSITALMGDHVPEDRQANGAALFQVSLNLTRSYAPFVGGALLAWSLVGFGGTYLVVAAIIAPALACVALMPKAIVAHHATVQGSMLAEMRLGVAHVLENRRLKEVMATFIVVILLGFSIMVVLPAYSKDVLGAGDAGFGIMFGMHAVGGLAAGLTVASKSGSPLIKRYLFVSSVGLGASVSLLGVMPRFAAGVAAIVLVGGFAGAFQTLVMAAILRATTPAYYGRVMALTNVGWALNNLFGLALGIFADLTSERVALVGIGVVIAAVSVGLALWAREERQRVATSPVG
jgi:predicted MFS family arabinose efflux permease